MHFFEAVHTASESKAWLNGPTNEPAVTTGIKEITNSRLIHLTGFFIAYTPEPHIETTVIGTSRIATPGS